MCIIVVKPAGVTPPSRETLRECFASNPDGAGLMWANGKTVTIRKGFMTFSDFCKALDKVPASAAAVYHFRISTHGGTKPELCHPFPLSSDTAELTALETQNRLGVTHNGVVHAANPAKGESDTLAFIRDTLAPLRTLCEDLTHNEQAQNVIKSVLGSKMAILDNSGDFCLIGEFIEDKGCYFSNTSYLPRVWSYSNYAQWWEDETAINDDFRAYLPFDCCKSCPDNDSCFFDFPICESEQEALDYLTELESEGVVCAK